MLTSCETSLLRPAEAAALLGIATSTTYRWMHSGRLPMVQLGRKTLRIPRQALQALIEERTQPVAPRRAPTTPQDEEGTHRG